MSFSFHLSAAILPFPAGINRHALKYPCLQLNCKMLYQFQLLFLFDATVSGMTRGRTVCYFDIMTCEDSRGLMRETSSTALFCHRFGFGWTPDCSLTFWHHLFRKIMTTTKCLLLWWGRTDLKTICNVSPIKPTIYQLVPVLTLGWS